MASVLLAADFFGSQIIFLTTQPPVRPLLYACLNLIILVILTKNLNLFAGKAIVKYSFAMAYIVMMLANLFYLATMGESPLLYSATVIMLFVALAVLVSIVSTRDGALVGNMHRGDRRAVRGGASRSMEG